MTSFIKETLALQLHPDKCKIITLDNGVGFLEFRIFYHYKLVRKKNIRKFGRKFKELRKQYEDGLLDSEKLIERFEGWLAYASHANTYKYRTQLLRVLAKTLTTEPTAESRNSKKQITFKRKIEIGRFPFSTQKTIYLLKKGASIKEIAETRNIKESTVWEHLAKLIEYNQLSLSRVLLKEKIGKILSNIQSKNDTLTAIKTRLNDSSISFNEINCVLASVKCNNKIHQKTIKNPQNL